MEGFGVTGRVQGLWFGCLECVKGLGFPGVSGDLGSGFRIGFRVPLSAPDDRMLENWRANSCHYRVHLLGSQIHGLLVEGVG